MRWKNASVGGVAVVVGLHLGMEHAKRSRAKRHGAGEGGPFSLLSYWGRGEVVAGPRTGKGSSAGPVREYLDAGRARLQNLCSSVTLRELEGMELAALFLDETLTTCLPKC